MMIGKQIHVGRFLIALLVFLCREAAIGFSQPELTISDPSVKFYYHHLVSELVQRPEVAAKFGVSEVDTLKIHNLRESKDYRRLASKLIFEESNPFERQADESNLIAELDDKIRRLLETVLPATTLKELRNWGLRCRHSSAFWSLTDDAILTYCDFPNDERLFLREPSNQLVVGYIRDHKLLREERVRGIFAMFSDDAKKAFVQYAGNKYFPDIPLAKQNFLAVIPANPRFSGFGMVLALSDPEIAKEIALRNDQIAQIEALTSNLSFKAKIRGLRASEVSAKIDETVREQRDACLRLLTDEQIAALRRQISLASFEVSPMEELSRPDV